VLKEIRGRLELLLGVGWTISASTVGQARCPAANRRIRLSTQIGSGLMGMRNPRWPSISLPEDNVKMIATLDSARYRQYHDRRQAADTIRAADHPSRWARTGVTVARRGAGHADQVLACKASPMQFPSGKGDCDARAAPEENGKTLTVRGARADNSKRWMCRSRRHAGGGDRRIRPGKSSLVSEILWALWKRLVDTRRCRASTTRSTGSSTCTRSSTSISRRSDATADPIPRHVGFTTPSVPFTQAPLSLERAYKAAIQFQRQRWPV
jgi:excinuclease UvrABC ATPase subunit